MNIKILGTGCNKCRKLYDNTLQAVSELGINAEVEKIEDFPTIASYGVMNTPAIVVNEEVKISGKLADVKEIIEILK